MSESLRVTRPDIELAAERWPGGSPVLEDPAGVAQLIRQAVTTA